MPNNQSTSGRAGKVFPVEITASIPLDDGKPLFLVYVSDGEEVAADISARKKDVSVQHNWIPTPSEIATLEAFFNDVMAAVRAARRRGLVS